MMSKIQSSGKPISMLVSNNNSTFTKKATGRITFTCNDGLKVDAAIAKAIATKEGQTVWLTSIGTNIEGVQVSIFNFEWSVKVRNVE